MTAATALQLPRELRPGLLRSGDPLFTWLLAASLAIAAAASAAIARVQPLEEVGAAEVPRIVRELILPLPIPPPAIVVPAAPAPVPVARPVLARPAIPAPAPGRGPVTARDVAGTGLLRHLDDGSALAGLLGPDDEDESVERALDDAVRAPGVHAGPIGGFHGADQGSATDITIPGSGGFAPVALGPKGDRAPAPAALLVSSEPPVVPGKQTTRALVSKKLRAMLPAFQRCYEKAVTRDRSLKGRMVVGFTIAAGGRVSEVEIEESQLGGSVDGCVRVLVRSLSFGAEISEELPVSYPLIFTPSG